MTEGNETATLRWILNFFFSNLSNWTFDRTTTVDIPIEDKFGTQFYRFKMADASITVTVAVGEDTNDGRPVGVFYLNGTKKSSSRI